MATKILNTAAIRTLHSLEITLKNNIDQVMKMGCEDPEAAEAIVFAIESLEKALVKSQVAKRNILRK